MGFHSFPGSPAQCAVHLVSTSRFGIKSFLLWVGETILILSWKATFPVAPSSIHYRWELSWGQWAWCSPSRAGPRPGSCGYMGVAGKDLLGVFYVFLHGPQWLPQE